MDSFPRLPGAVAFRLFDPSDSYAELTELLHRAYAALAAEGLLYVASRQSEEVTRKRCAAGECHVGLIDGRTVATVTLSPPGLAGGRAPWYARPDVAKIQQFAVEPSLQGRGIGSALMDRVEARALELGAAEVALDTSVDASRLIRYYEARGYRKVGDIDWRPHTNYMSVILSLDLARPRRENREKGPGTGPGK
jgi:GNAT superfamily N-acetyltransferase